MEGRGSVRCVQARIHIMLFEGIICIRGRKWCTAWSCSSIEGPHSVSYLRLPSRTCALIPTNTRVDIIFNAASLPSMAKKSLLTGVFKRKFTEEASRFYAMHPGILGAQAYITVMGEDNDDDARFGSPLLSPPSLLVVASP